MLFFLSLMLHTILSLALILQLRIIIVKLALSLSSPLYIIAKCARVDEVVVDNKYT